MKKAPPPSRGRAVASTGTIYVAPTGRRRVLKLPLPGKGINIIIIKKNTPQTPGGGGMVENFIYWEEGNYVNNKKVWVGSV